MTSVNSYWTIILSVVRCPFWQLLAGINTDRSTDPSPPVHVRSILIRQLRLVYWNVDVEACHSIRSDQRYASTAAAWVRRPAHGIASKPVTSAVRNFHLQNIKANQSNIRKPSLEAAPTTVAVAQRTLRTKYVVVTCIHCRKEHFSSRNRDLWPLTLTFEHDLNKIKMNQKPHSYVILIDCSIWVI